MQRRSKVTQELNVSIDSDDSMIAKLIKMKQKEELNKKGKAKLPFYLKESLPDPKFMSAKNMALSFPDNVERPSVDKLEIMVA